ncbi:MAG: diguanylate cyclase, partial [Actinobacteria bacterium]
RLDPADEACLYRVAKEAVSNVVRHSGATAFEVRIVYDDDKAALSVSDDGCGFEAARVLDGETGRLGLKSIRDRVEREGGVLSVASANGRGTVLTVELPVGGRT